MAAGSDQSATTVLQFVLRALAARRQQVFAQQLALVAAIALLPVALLLYVAPVAALAAAAFALLVGIGRGLLAARRLSAPLAPGLRDGTLVDELLTWLEARQGGRGQTPVIAWLCDDLARELPRITAGEAAAAGRLRLGRVRALLPIAVVLLLIYWFDRLWPLLPPGFGGGADQPVPQARGPGEGSGAGGKERQPEGDTPQPLPDPAPDQPPDAPPDEQPPAPPPPLLELPEDRSFVPPTFVGDGDSRRALANVAEVGEGNAAKLAPTAANRTERIDDVPAQEQFRRAAERAEQSRHVPAHERALVRRYFEAMQKAATR